MSNPVNPGGTVGSFTAMLPTMSALNALTQQGRGSSVTEQIREHARQSGYDEGYADGLALGRQEGLGAIEAEYRQEVQRFVAELDQSAAAMKNTVLQWQAGLESPLASLAVVIATQILGRELTLDPDAVIGIARQAVGEVTHASTARIRVNPFQAPVVRARQSDILAASVSLRSVEVVDDPTITSGCVIESDGGTVDAQIDGMIATALHTLRGDA